MNLSRIRDNVKNYGLAAGVHDVTKLAVNKIVPVRILRAVRLTHDRLDRSFLEGGEGLEQGFADADALARWAVDPCHDIDERWARERLCAGDRCYAIWQGDTLASYGWYSREPQAISRDLLLRFSPDHVYMYKGFTLPAYRGRRLHALGMANALEAYTRELGLLGMLSYVESNNFASLKSCFRMGYEHIGNIYVCAPRGRHIIWSTGRCEEFAMRLEPLVS